ncbi:SRPBCC family protein [Phytoactinopolyspora halotolerans]|uniref:Carbon monoxide dehydrogenase subunit G n=1 Tax=Phytoactinopolyspora halotolerans TaxID=1981512 RepID=A0A6L9SDL8_9ACTN|nr:carbon monoxide dehydrogenase subunit G [Phytoactinopolyspora halotolerans]NEE02130.1 carbon monoxide dehydrogenase subunit G [Phytoactinopolyspora halotolerans]
MKVSGSATLHATRERVWSALNDPAVLVRTIPGCVRLEETGTDTYAMTVRAGVGSVKGTYAGQVRLGEQDEPSSFLLRASGSGAPGTVSADVRVSLHENGTGTTRLEYDADAIVGGMIAGVGQRMLTGVATKTAGEFFAAVDDVLAGVDVGAIPAQRPAGADETAQSDDEQGRARPAASAVYEPSTAGRPGRAGMVARQEFAWGVLAGAAIALAGVAVGARIAGRRRTGG